MITQSELKMLLTYDPETGIFYWNEPPRGRVRGSVAGSVRANGYWRIMLGRKEYLAHRLAWLYMNGYFPDQVDHINHARCDNRMCNLRQADATLNNRNKSLQINNELGVRGVRKNKNCKTYRTAIYRDGRTIHLGNFKEIADASAAYEKAKRELHGV